MGLVHVSVARRIMSFAARSKPHSSCCRTKLVLIVHYREGQKMRRRNFPKGYAEMLEKQHNQLVSGLQEMYQRLRKASLWEGEPLNESSGRPLTHDILAALNLLEPQEDGSNEEFIEQPQSSPMLEGLDDDDDVAKTPAASSQELSQSMPHDQAMLFDSDLPARSTSSRSSSKAISPTTPGPHQQLGHPYLQPAVIPNAAKQPLPALSPPIQLDALWDDPLYGYDVSQAGLFDVPLDNTAWCFEPTAALPPLTTQMPGLYQDLSSHKRNASAPRLSLSHNWLGNGIGFDSSDFMSDLYRLSPQDITETVPSRPRKTGSLT
jgi:hypothetical protein